MSTQSTVSFDPHHPDFLGNPYPYYARLREEDPVVVVEPYGHPWIFRHDDVAKVLTDESFGKEYARDPDRVPGPFRMMSRFPRGLFGSDPPRHTVLRAAVEPAAQRGLGKAPQVASELASALAENVSRQQYAELMTEFALPLPAGVLFTLMGIPGQDWDALGRWVFSIAAAHDITQRPSVRGMGATCTMALKTYFSAFVSESLDAPGDGIVGELCRVAAREPDGPLSSDDIQMVCMDFVVAGYLSTSYLIGTGLTKVLEDPALVAALRDDPMLMAGAVREMLRYDAPAQIVDRVVLVETEMRGQTLRPGTSVSAIVGSANRDPHAFERPDDFLITREEPHLSYGAGVHFCIGDALANAVAPAAISALLAARPLVVDGIPQWQTDPYLRGMTSLPVRFDAS
jgi:pimeloyl-[acyl-carrier protein] synthase